MLCKWLVPLQLWLAPPPIDGNIPSCPVWFGLRILLNLSTLEISESANPVWEMQTLVFLGLQVQTSILCPELPLVTLLPANRKVIHSIQRSHLQRENWGKGPWSPLTHTATLQIQHKSWAHASEAWDVYDLFFSLSDTLELRMPAPPLGQNQATVWSWVWKQTKKMLGTQQLVSSRTLIIFCPLGSPHT